MSVFSEEYFIGLTKKRGKILVAPMGIYFGGEQVLYFYKNKKKAKKKEIGLDLNPFGFVELS